MKCWEFMECGREEGGPNVDKMGLCPAYPNNGENCYLIAGTFCDGEPQGRYARGKNNCVMCKFFQKIHRPRLMTQVSMARGRASEEVRND